MPVDRNTGVQTTPYGQQQSYGQSTTTGPSTAVTTGTSNAVTTTNQNAISSNYALNTTPAARAALDTLIKTLSDRPVISAEDAAVKFPEATRQFDRVKGWYYVNPTTGQVMSNAEAELYNKEQQAKQQQYIVSGGMIAGGTIAQKALEKERMTEIQRNRVTQDKYSKEAAFADAKGLANYFTRILTEQQLPGILRGAEGSGASQGTTRALLTQQAIARNAEGAAKVGIDAAAAYGNVNVSLANVLEELTKNDPNSIANQLLQALNISKGIETSGSSATSGSTTQNTTGTQNQTTVNSGNTQVTNKQVNPQPTITMPQYEMPAPAYTPSAQAGTGYIVANAPQNEPYAEANFISYGSDDSNVIFED